MFSIFRNINNLAGRSKVLDIIGIFLARWLIYIMVIALIFCAMYFHSRGMFAYSLLSGLCSAFVFSKIINIFYKELRPAEFKTVKVLIPVPPNPSFPSRHASLLFGISFYLFFYNTILGIVFLVLSYLVGISRVFCGVHWPRDIIAGCLLGAVSSGLIYLLLSFIK